jgi:DNA invertase Pin-like site-specific DNA recombinase
MGKQAAIYVRVSTDNQTVENQERELRAVAERSGWTVVRVYKDEGISGARGRDKRPGLDGMLKDVARRKVDVVMAWSVDRLGRSLHDLVTMLGEMHGAGVDLFLHQQGVDTSTPAGKALFQMLGVFAEFERSIIQARIVSGIARAKANGVVFGRPRLKKATEQMIRETLGSGLGIVSTARRHGVGVSAVQRIKAAMVA